MVAPRTYFKMKRVAKEFIKLATAVNYGGTKGEEFREEVIIIKIVIWDVGGLEDPSKRTRREIIKKAEPDILML